MTAHEPPTTRRFGRRASDAAAATLFAGPGEVRALCRAVDWEATPLGPVHDWPASLHVLVRTMLASRHPMFLWWGPELIQFYNDAYRPSLGDDGRHERAPGAAGEAFWPDIWHIIGPEIAEVMAGGEATWHEDQLVPIARNGRMEEVWWTYSYSPAFDDAGEVFGVLVICQETTTRILADREHARLRAETTRAEQHAARILAQVNDAHVTMDAAFRIQSLNAAAERAIGKSLAAVAGRTHWQVYPDSIGTEIERQYRHVMAERTDSHFAHHYTGDGYDFHLEIDVYPTDDGGLAVFWRDVSERVRAGDERRALDVQYRALFDAIDAGFCTVEIVPDETGAPSDYRFLEVNPAFAVQTGLTDAVGRCAREVIPGLEDVWIERYGRVAASGESARFQLGSDVLGRWFDVFAFRVSHADQRRVGILFTDITAAKQAERDREALLRVVDAERARLVDVFQTAPAFLAILRGPTHVFELANDAYYQLIGHRDIIGKSVVDAVPEAVEQEFIGLLDHVLATGEPFVGREIRIMLQRTPDAPLEERFLDFVYTPHVEHGERVGIIAHGHDVTEQVRSRRDVERLRDESEAARMRAEQAEAGLRVLADAIPTLAWTARADGYIDWYNARWYEYTGTTLADMEGWGWQSVHDPATLPLVLEQWEASIADGVPVEMTFPLRGADGEFRQFLARVVPARDADGTVVRWFGTCTDVEPEARLRRAAEEANRAKSEFLAIMSHELRTPLNAIDGYAELMELGVRGPITEEQRHDLGRIRTSERHLLGLINGVLNFTQVEAGAVHYELEDVRLNEVLATCEELTAPQIRSKGLTFRRQPADPALHVRADREKLQQVVLNLLSNAIKFTEPGGRIELRWVLARDAGEPVIRIMVADTGIGIPPNQIARIFEPFVQVDSRLTRLREGTGLGLAISRDLARGMGGSLIVESAPAVGSTFTLTLPAAQDESIDKPQ